MGIQIEFNPDLALRDISHYEQWLRKKEECIPPVLEAWKVYDFLKSGQRNYYLLDDEPIPLIKTDGNQILSRPYWSIKILEATHYAIDSKVWTKGKYLVLNVFNIEDPTIHFEWFLSVKSI